MIRELSIKGLRGIEEATIEGLAPVTVLLGPNGSGKSTVLEALGVICAQRNTVEAFRALSKREWLGVHALKFWIREGVTARVSAEEDDTSAQPPIQRAPFVDLQFRLLRAGEYVPRGMKPPLAAFSLQWAPTTDGESLGSEIRVDDDGNTTDEGNVIGARSMGPAGRPYELVTAFVERAAATQFTFAHFSSALREALTAIKLLPEYDELITNLQILRPRLVSIESLALGEHDEPFMFEKEPRTAFPVAYAGDGFRRSLLLAAAFARTRGGLVAIDEPEAFAHPSLFEAVCKLIAKASQAGTQVVMATHSLEFVSALLREFSGALEKTAVIGLSMENRRISSVLIPGADAERRVLELGHDLRL